MGTVLWRKEGQYSVENSTKFQIKNFNSFQAENLENEHIKFKRLPYDHCCLTHIPFENPYCDENGNIFEYTAILKFIKHFKKNPITGSDLEAKSLIQV